MAQTRQLMAIIEREGDGYVSLCPELDVASQGMSVEEARLNLIEALELFFETADPSEIESRLSGHCGQESKTEQGLRPLLRYHIHFPGRAAVIESAST